MKRTIAIALAILGLTAFPAHADVQRSFPDGYVILDADAALSALIHADVQSSFPDGYVIVEADPELRTPWLSHEELVGSFPQPSFIDYVAIRTGEPVELNSLARVERETRSN